MSLGLPMDSQAALASALELHHAGRFIEAEEAYRRIAADSTRGADALFLRGVIALNDRRPEEAARLMARAIALQPSAGHFYVDRGTALQALGTNIHLCASTPRESARSRPANR